MEATPQRPSGGLLSCRVFTRTNAMLFACLSLALPLSVIAADDAYLQELSQEVNKPEYVKGAESEIRASEATEKVQGDKQKELAYKTIESFEAILKKQYPSSHTLYLKLTTEQRLKVHQTYLKTGKLSVAKRKIVDIFLQY